MAYKVIALEDETGMVDLVIFPRVQGPCGRVVLSRKLVFMGGVLKKHHSRAVSVEVRKPINLSRRQLIGFY